MATTAQYASTVKSAIAQISTANTNRNGTGTIGTVFTGAAGGSRIDDITITATGTTTAGVVRLFINDGTTSYDRYSYLDHRIELLQQLLHRRRR